MSKELHNQSVNQCVKCGQNPKEYNDYCYACAVAIIAQFKENQLRELMCDIRAQRKVGDLK